MAIHYTIKCTVAIARLFLLTDIAIKIECKLKALVLKQVGISVEHYVVLGVAVCIAQTLLVHIANR